MKNKFALYVHWPFCKARCTYCDFRAFPHQEKRIAAYAQTVREEVNLLAARIPEGEVTSLYFGGGTPSHVPAAELETTVRAIRAAFAVAPGAECTVEANPEDVTPAWAAQVRAMGFNRVSLGVQTFDETLLAAIGRTHDARQAETAVNVLRAAGMENLSLDLMVGLPGQTVEAVRRDMGRLSAIEPPHLSVYSLTVAEGTRMHRRLAEEPDAFPSEETERAMMHAVEEVAAAQGYLHYEISNFAKPGKESRHNLAYWRLQPYLGIGLDAAGYWNGAHYHNPASLRTYTERIRAGRTFLDEPEPLTAEQLATELLLTGLRLAEGISPEDVRRRTGIDLRAEKEAAAQGLMQQGLLTEQNGRWIATRKGRDLLDTILRELMM